MFKLNREVKTKSGEILTPFLVEKETVYCFGKSGKTIIKNITDFNFGPEKKESLIVVNPVLESTDELFELEKPIIIPPPLIEEKTKVIVEKKEKPTIDPGLIDNEKYI